MREKKPIAERFWPKVQKSGGCWNWNAGTYGNGYGIIGGGGRGAPSRLAHRVSWEIHNGKIPDGLHVCHKCDNPLCVRPDHLFLGTGKDNMQDCKRKGRLSQGISLGERNGNHRLTDEQVAQIRELRRTEGLSYPQLAKRFGIVHSTARVICTGQIRKSA